MTTELVEIPFYAQTLTAIETENGPYVPLKPLCEAFEIDWSAQLKRLKARKAVMGMAVFAIPSAGGEQETTCIPVNRLAAWLMLLNPKIVREDLRDMLELYQMEAADVLDRHFRLKQHEKDAQFDHCQRHLLVANQKWQKIRDLEQLGCSPRMVARRCNFSTVQYDEERAAMANCGLVPSERWNVKDAAPTDADTIRRLRLQVAALEGVLEGRDALLASYQRGRADA